MIILLLIIIAYVLLFGKEETKNTIGGILVMLAILAVIGMIFC